MIPLAAAMLLVAAGPPPAAQEELPALRAEMDAAEDRATWDAAAAELLRGLERSGRSGSSEAAWIVGRLLESRPGDPALLWRRAELRRRQTDVRGAIDDLERLVRAAPGHPLALRARRALPALYLRAGMHAMSARADEALLRERIADPVAVLARLARTYAGMSRLSDVERTLDRLEALAPDRARYDPEIAWLRVTATGRLGSREAAADALLAFANLFTWDARRDEALLLAAEAYAELGRTPLALALTEELAGQADVDEKLASSARLLRGRLLEQRGERGLARAEYVSLLADASDPGVAASAMQRLIDAEVEERGAESALLMLAGLAGKDDRFARPMARMHVERLIAALDERIAVDPRAAAFHVELARRLDVDLARAPRVVLAAAGFHDRLGDRDAADELYASVDPAVVDGAATAARVRRARLRSRPALAAAGPMEPGELAQRLGEMERGGTPAAALEAADAAAASLTAEARTIAARAALAQGKPDRALELVAPLSGPDAALALVRGDARAVLGMRDAACAEFALARSLREGGAALTGPADPAPSGETPADAWLELRLAECALRAGNADDGRRRLEALLASAPGEPAAFAARDLLRGAAAAGDGRTGGGPPS